MMKISALVALSLLGLSKLCHSEEEIHQDVTFSSVGAAKEEDCIGTAFSPLQRQERYQQVFQAKAFDEPFVSMEYELDEVIIIKAITLYRDSGEGSLLPGSNPPKIQVRLSTTMKETSDELSPIFQDNLGPDEKLVYEGLLTTSPGNSNEIIIELSNPFLYDSCNGNLFDGCES